MGMWNETSNAAVSVISKLFEPKSYFSPIPDETSLKDKFLFTNWDKKADQLSKLPLKTSCGWDGQWNPSVPWSDAFDKNIRSIPHYHPLSLICSLQNQIITTYVHVPMHIFQPRQQRSMDQWDQWKGGLKLWSILLIFVHHNHACHIYSV